LLEARTQSAVSRKLHHTSLGRPLLQQRTTQLFQRLISAYSHTWLLYGMRHTQSQPAAGKQHIKNKSRPST
jgi:hypothetical protein